MLLKEYSLTIYNDSVQVLFRANKTTVQSLKSGPSTIKLYLVLTTSHPHDVSSHVCFDQPYKNKIGSQNSLRVKIKHKLEMLDVLHRWQ